MSDKVSSITSKLDRAEPTVKGIKTSKKKMVFILFAVLALVCILIAVSLSLGRLEEAFKEKEEKTVASNYEEGKQRDVKPSMTWLEEARKKVAKRKAEKEPEPEPAEPNEPKKPEPVVKEVKVQKKTKPEPARPAPKIRYVNSNPKPTPPPAKKEPPPPTQAELSLARKLNSGVSYVSEESSNTEIGEYYKDGEQAQYDDSFDGSVFEPGYARARKKGANSFILTHGTSIPCSLYTQVISDYSGFVTCRVTQDVYSANGSVLLIERGSKVSGTQKVSLTPGKSRVYTKWGEIETPDGVMIRIDSLGTGQLGATGNEAWIDNHYPERFGGAILLSFVDDTLATAANSVTGDSVVTDASRDNVSNITRQALEQNLNISPTGYTKIGQRINIMIVRDIDFSNVYALEGF